MQLIRLEHKDSCKFVLEIHCNRCAELVHVYIYRLDQAHIYKHLFSNLRIVICKQPLSITIVLREVEQVVYIVTHNQ